MQLALNEFERVAFRHLLFESSGDIALRLDRRGFIEHASDNLAEIGVDLAQMLVKPHISDLAGRAFAHAVGAYFTQTLDAGHARSPGPERIEFPLRDCDGWREQDLWFELTLRAVTDATGALVGAMGLMRSIDRLRALEGEVFARVLVDPLTGLANRHAFGSALRRQLASGEAATMALFEIERMRAIFMQYGQRAGDEITWGFARFLEAMADPGHELAQFDGERFAMIVPGDPEGAAREWVRDVIETFNALSDTGRDAQPRLAAIAGLAAIECSADWTLRQGEVALVLARARGGMQIARRFPGGPRRERMCA